MSDRDPQELADRLEHEADQLERRRGELDDRARAVGQDWERKRADQGVPGALPPEGSKGPEGGEADAREAGSPAPDAPPPEAGPSDAETPSEGASGPPSDTED